MAMSAWRYRRVRTLEGLNVGWLEAEEKMPGKRRVVEVLAMVRDEVERGKTREEVGEKAQLEGIEVVNTGKVLVECQ